LPPQLPRFQRVTGSLLSIYLPHYHFVCGLFPFFLLLTILAADLLAGAAGQGIRIPVLPTIPLLTPV
jgi:hypothetical protein